MVRPGMILRDGLVKRVDVLGRRHAVRLWTHHPAWLPMSNDLSVGSRWHEIMEGWLAFHREEEEDGTDVELWDRVYGLPVSSGARSPWSGEPQPAQWWEEWRGRRINRAALGEVDHILYTLRERGDMRATYHGPASDQQFFGRPNRLEFPPIPRGMARKPLGTWGDDPRRRVELPVPETRPLLARHKWTDLRHLLVSGPDVVRDAAA